MFPATEIEALLALNRIGSGYTQLGKRVKNVADSVLQFFNEFRPDRTDLPRKIVKKMQESRSSIALSDLKRSIDLDLRWLERSGQSIISIFDEDYPFLLMQIYDPPLCLFAIGNKEILSSDQVAMVGSRKPTAAGLKIATSFAASLSERSLVVTSGLAFGIDAAAHTGALKRTGRTIAVLGTGCDVIYPRQHERLTLRIIEHGLIVSEYPLATPAFPSNFPRRNRIVTGLAMGTLVVEAALKSGSLISARLAVEQSREVFAVPGSIYSLQSEGCHQLIRDGAKLTQTVEDVIEELPGYALQEQSMNRRLQVPATGYPDVMRHLGAAPMSADGLFELTGVPISDLLVALVQLEIEGFIVSSPQGYMLSK